MSVDAPYAYAVLPGTRRPFGIPEEMARSLSLKPERDARALVGRVAALAERASLQELRAEIARIGLALSNAEMARRLSGA